MIPERSDRPSFLAVVLVPVAFALTLSTGVLAQGGGTRTLNVSAPLMTDSAARSGRVATSSVVRVSSTRLGKAGTGFLHRSGMIITNEHVVPGHEPSDFVVDDSRGVPHLVTSIVADATLDLALLRIDPPLSAPALDISTGPAPAVGILVSTWGYPSGYHGNLPLLAVGVVSGWDLTDAPSGARVERLVVNAAFNSGNSGGPLLDIETGKVVGVVCSKMAPFPAPVQSALAALAKRGGILQYTATTASGVTTQVSEGEVVAKVLEHFKSQTQLVVGFAVTPGDLVTFLRRNGVTP